MALYFEQASIIAAVVCSLIVAGLEGDNRGRHANRRAAEFAHLAADITLTPKLTSLASRPPRVGRGVAPRTHRPFFWQARKRMRTESRGYRRDHLRALAQRVEIDANEVRIMGSKSVLLRTLIAASSAKTAGFSVPSFVPKWRARRDSNSRPPNS